MTKSIKRGISLFLALVFVLTLLPAAALATEEPANKFEVEVSSVLANGDVTTVTGTVDADYQAKLVLPNAKVNPGNVAVDVTMTDVASLGVEGSRNYHIALNTGIDHADVDLPTYMSSLYNFDAATINANITGVDGTKAAVTYELAGNGTEITGTTKTEEARAAWQLMVGDNFSTATMSDDDSYFKIVNGSWLQIGTEKLVFETENDLILDDLQNFDPAYVQDNVKLEENQPSALAFELKAGTELKMGQSVATLNNDMTVTVTGMNLDDMKVLPEIRNAINDKDADTADLVLLAVGMLDAVVNKVDVAENVNVDIVFTCPHAHTEVIPAVTATCIRTGLTEGLKCADCGEILTAQKVVDMIPHETVPVPGYAATCTTAGLTDGARCVNCGTIVSVGTVIPALGHNHVVTPAVAPTCAATGWTMGETCDRCGYVFTAREEVEKLPHTWDEGVVTTVPTYDTTGVLTKTCTVCGATTTEVIPVLPLPVGPTGPTGGTTITDPDVPLAGVLPFDDVTENDWFYDAVKYVYDNELMSGIDDNTFDPYMDTTRGMIVTILYRLEGSPAVTGTAKFADVATGDYYHDAVVWGTTNGIIAGYDETNYGPNDTITREQFAAILLRYAKYKGYDVKVTDDASLDFTDADKVSDYAEEALLWTVEKELIRGMGDGTVSPNTGATRAQAATILMGFAENIAK